MATAAIGAGASLLSGVLGGKGAAKAAKAQAAAYQKGIDEQHAQFAQTQKNFAPFLQAGTGALDDYGNLVGMNGGVAQQSAIDLLKASPGYQSLYNTGSDTVLQNASATGGLRGGNTQSSLANFGSGLLAQTIQQQLGNLGGLISVGSGSANSLGSFGQQSASNVSNLLGQQGGANATAAAAPYAAIQGLLNQVGGNVKSGNGAFSGIKGAGW